MTPRTNWHRSLRPRSVSGVSRPQDSLCTSKGLEHTGQYPQLVEKKNKKQVAQQRRERDRTSTVRGKTARCYSGKRKSISQCTKLSDGTPLSASGGMGLDADQNDHMVAGVDSELCRITVSNCGLKTNPTMQSIVVSYKEDVETEPSSENVKPVEVRFAPCQYCDLCGSWFVLRSTELEKHVKEIHPLLVERIDLPQKALMPRGILSTVGTFEMPGNTFSIGPYAALTLMCLEEPGQLFSHRVRDLVLLNRLNGRRYRVYPRVLPLPSFEVPEGGFRRYPWHDKRSLGYWPRAKDSDLGTLLDVLNKFGYREAFCSGAMSVLTEYKPQRVEVYPSDVIDCRLCGTMVLLHPLEVVFHLALHGLPLEKLFASDVRVDWRRVECVACSDLKRPKLIDLDIVGLLRHLKQCSRRNRLMSRGSFPLCLFEHVLASSEELVLTSRKSLHVPGFNRLAEVHHYLRHVPGWCTAGEGSVVGPNDMNGVWAEHSYARCGCAAEVTLSLCEFPRVVIEEDYELDALSTEEGQRWPVPPAEEVTIKVEDADEEPILNEVGSDELRDMIYPSSIKPEPLGNEYFENDDEPQPGCSGWSAFYRFDDEVIDPASDSS
ncbi:hypothetical protein BIW11_09946 [Tropilaelaps mercedesae]|uniref:Uncharacterized protein n=1 Tax=Tropilaelaps mercedesae TaxID=418985 RepID=A0A1V9XI61_9ACAR|nr:hypothetical protein BIW11_09946 [Tropilaelaps mercedesae]